MKTTSLALILSIFCIIPMMGNGLEISSLSRDSLNQTVTFDLKWENSWRVDSSGVPSNWDAIWVIVKLQTCDADPLADWTHGLVSPTLSDHNFGILEPVLSDGSAIGIDAAPNNTGVMLRRNANGLFASGPASTITLRMTNMLPNEAYNLRVIGMEMVFVPQAAYELGGIPYSNAFSSTVGANDPSPVTISTEASQTVISHAGGLNNSVVLPAGFPKGVNAFHLMKYEISAEQFAVFLNTIGAGVQYNRYPGSYGLSRNMLAASGTYPDVFVGERGSRAQNYIGWNDLAAYLDWAALRPMTELEFEKASRGQEPSILDQYPWGTATTFQLTNITSPENGTEIPATFPANVHYGNPLFAGGDGGRGPIRVGMFATPSAQSRVETGAGFYGHLDLAGNIAEACVAVSSFTSTTGTIAFTNAPGDGVLSNTGSANEAGWPEAGSGTIVLRGGAYNQGVGYLRISDRTSFPWTGARAANTGGRGARN